MLVTVRCYLEGDLTLADGSRVTTATPGDVLIVDEANGISLLNQRAVELLDEPEAAVKKAEPKRGKKAEQPGQAKRIEPE